MLTFQAVLVGYELTLTQLHAPDRLELANLAHPFCFYKLSSFV